MKQSFKQENFVSSSLRKVQLIAGFKTTGQSTDERRIRAGLSEWQAIYRQFATSGVAAYFTANKEIVVPCDYLFIMDDALLISYLPSHLGLYLWRGGRIYRQQPANYPKYVLSQALQHLDYYSFRICPDDNIFCVVPSIVDKAGCANLHRMFAQYRGNQAILETFSNLALSDDYLQDFYVAIDVQHLETEKLTDEKREYAFRSYLSKSKVMPLENGNLVLTQSNWPGDRKNVDKNDFAIPTFAHAKSNVFADFTRDSRDLPHRSETRHEITNFVNAENYTGFERTSQNDTASTRGSFPTTAAANARIGENVEHDKALYDSSNPYAAKPDVRRHSLSQKLKYFRIDESMHAIKTKFRKLHARLTNLFPYSKGLSWLAYIAVLLLMILILTFVFTSLKNHKRQSLVTPITSKTTIAADSDSYEIKVEVVANTLSVFDDQNLQNLVATLKRNDFVYQVEMPQNGIVKVRLADGRQGFVEEKLLFPDVKPDISKDNAD